MGVTWVTVVLLNKHTLYPSPQRSIFDDRNHTSPTLSARMGHDDKAPSDWEETAGPRIESTGGQIHVNRWSKPEIPAEMQFLDHGGKRSLAVSQPSPQQMLGTLKFDPISLRSDGRTMGSKGNHPYFK